MGVDILFMVLENFPARERSFVSDVLSLQRDGSLAEFLEPLFTEQAGATRRQAVQLPAGAQTTFGDGRPADSSSGEPGWLTEDPYGSPLFSIPGYRLAEHLAKHTSEYQFNRWALAYIIQQFPDREIVLYLH